MTLSVRFRRQLHARRPYRLLMGATIGALLGIAAGKNLTGTVSIVDGQSMAPAFESGARVFTTAINSPILRGDVVLIDDGRGEYALKRVVGLPGETIHLWRGYVFVNRKLLVEPYLPKYTFTFPSQETERNRFVLTPDQYFVLGDNRLFSVDSRVYGGVPGSRIKARVPSAGNAERPRTAAYTLPPPGKTSIQSAGAAVPFNLR